MRDKSNKAMLSDPIITKPFIEDLNKMLLDPTITKPYEDLKKM
jgi:hypothetical protein